MKQIFAILVGFLPWMAFAGIAGPSMFRLDAAIIAAFVLVIITGAKQLAHGFILTWGSLLFFGINLVMVVCLRNAWVISNLDVLSQGALAVIAWFSVFIGRPFVLQYARQTVPPERQAAPAFFQTCQRLSMIWGVIFVIATLMSAAKSYGWLADGAGYRAVSLGLIGLGLWLNHWYPKYVRSRTGN